MANISPFLKMTLPENSEYMDTWDSPLNDNFLAIDTWAKDIQDEIVEARFGKTSLFNFLSLSHNSDGSLKPTDEVKASRSSALYGNKSATSIAYTLYERLAQGDLETLKLRAGYSDTREMVSNIIEKKNAVLSGPKDSNGYPTWIGYTGVNLQVDGSATPVVFSIFGKIAKLRKNQQVVISGGAGARYLAAVFNEDGLVTVDGDSATPPPASSTGTIGSDGVELTILEDLEVDFTTKDVRAGDVLDILGTGDNAGRYLIKTVAPGGNVNRLQVIGIFPGATESSVAYNVRDFNAVSFVADTAKDPAKFYVAELYFDGSAITSAMAISYSDFFVGEWRSVDLAVTPTFTETWNHALFDDAIEVTYQVSQANDGSQPVEFLTVMGIENTLLLSNTLALNPATPQALTGAVAFTGGVTPTRGIKASVTNKTVTISNLVNNFLYKDFSGASRNSGFVRVIAKRVR